MDPLLVGALLGVAFATLDLAVLWPPVGWSRNRERVRALAGTAVTRFATGFLLGAIDVGAPGWIAGVVLGGGLSLPLTAIDRAPGRVIAMGLAGGLWVGVLGEALREGIARGAG